MIRFVSLIGFVAQVRVMASKVLDETPEMFRHLESDETLEAVYFFYGEDTFLIDRLRKAVIRKRFGGQEPDGLNYEQYWAGEADVMTVLTAVRSISLFGEKKLVIYRDIDRLKEEDLVKITAYITKPARACFVMTAGKLDMRKKSYAQICKLCARSVCCPVLEDRDYDHSAVDAFVASEANKLGLRLDAEAAVLVRDFLGPNRGMIVQALEKLSLANRTGQTVTPAFVREQLVDIRERGAFELASTLVRRDLQAFVISLKALMDQKQEPVAMNGMLAGKIRQLLLYKLCQDKRMTQNEITQTLGLNPRQAYPVLKECGQAAGLFTTTELKRLHRILSETDRAIKSSSLPKEYKSLEFYRILFLLMGDKPRS